MDSRKMENRNCFRIGFIIELKVNEPFVMNEVCQLGTSAIKSLDLTFMSSESIIMMNKFILLRNIVKTNEFFLIPGIRRE